MDKQSRMALVALIALATAFRTEGLFANTFHSDEALFASWARYIAVWRDPLLESQLVDKPPLLFYLQALFFPLMGPEMWAARLPNFIASLALIPLSAILVWRLYRSETAALLTAAFVVASPLAIQFSSSAFIDPLMCCLVVASLAMAVNRRLSPEERLDIHKQRGPSWATMMAGALFGLATLSKYQAWLFMPLLAGMAMILPWRRAEWRGWLLGFLPMFGLQVIWELLRGNELSLFQAQLQSYGGLRLAWSWELWPRLQAWVGQWSYFLKSPVLEMLLLLALPLIIALLIDQHDRSAALDRLVVLFVFAYSLVLWFVAVPVWDRYILALTPFISIALARAISRLATYAMSAIAQVVSLPEWTKNLRVIAPLALVAIQVAPIAHAQQGRLAIGATPSADQGAAEIAQALRNEPYGTVLYDHWYSWQWRYHLLDGKVYVSWFPDADALLEDLEVFGGENNRRYIALPDTMAARPVQRALIDSGYSLTPVALTGGQRQGGGIVLLLIEPPGGL